MVVRHPRQPLPALLLAGSLGLLVACDDTSDVVSDVGAGGDASEDVGRSDGLDGGDDGGDGPETIVDGGALAGPIVLVAHELVMIQERLCDLDGDGSLDNAIADLGTPGAELLTATLSSLLASSVERGIRTVIHLPLVDDRATPAATEAVVYVYSAHDTDEPRFNEDDFSGEEPFHVDEAFLDPCGEPRHRLEHVALEDGRIQSESGTILLTLATLPIELRGARIDGTLEPWGAAAEITLCTFAPLSELAASPGFGEDSSSTLLEEMLAGGAAFGVPSVPGLSPNVDVDGDGVERLIVDEDGHVTTCVDGDDTEIPGRDCWMDERIVDGIALTLGLSAVSARFAGREPGWEYEVEGGGCPEGPPETSLFGPPREGGLCVERNEPCEPWASSPCCSAEDRCSGANDRTYRCLGPCEASACDYGELLGYCSSSGACHPIARTPDDAGCEPGSTGCVTEYGVSTGTTCFDGSTRAYCYESCDVATGSCPGEGTCMPDPFDDRGLCVVAEPS